MNFKLVSDRSQAQNKSIQNQNDLCLTVPYKNFTNHFAFTYFLKFIEDFSKNLQEKSCSEFQAEQSKTNENDKYLSNLRCHFNFLCWGHWFQMTGKPIF
jgi:hypothetical protein